MQNNAWFFVADYLTIWTRTKRKKTKSSPQNYNLSNDALAVFYQYQTSVNNIIYLSCTILVIKLYNLYDFFQHCDVTVSKSFPVIDLECFYHVNFTSQFV